MANNITEEQYQTFLGGLLASDRIMCTQVVQGILAPEMDIKKVYVDLFQRAMYEVGERWEKGQISVAVEHVATAIVERLLTIVEKKIFTGVERTHTAIIACVADEYHYLGARIVADVFEMYGWRCYFLGANSPLTDLMHMIHTHTPEVVGLSLSIYFNLPALMQVHASVRKDFPELKLVIGGQAFRWGTSAVLEADPFTVCISSINDLERFLTSYGT